MQLPIRMKKHVLLNSFSSYFSPFPIFIYVNIISYQVLIVLKLLFYSIFSQNTILLHLILLYKKKQVYIFFRYHTCFFSSYFYHHNKYTNVNANPIAAIIRPKERLAPIKRLVLCITSSHSAKVTT